MLTANLAIGWGFAAEHVAQEYVLTPSAARLVAVAFMPALARSLGGADGRDALSDDAAPGGLDIARLEELREQQAAVETIVRVWRRAMWVVAGLMELAVLVAAATGRPRWPHLFIAVLMLLSAIGTLIGMRLLIAPDYGGMEPLPWRSYLYLAGVMSTYPAVLVVAYARRPRRQVQAT